MRSPIAPALLAVATAGLAFSPSAFASTASLQVGPEVSFGSSVSTATESFTSVSVPVILSQTAAQAVSVPYTVSGTATSSDASVAPGPLVIAAGQTSGTILVQLSDDNLSEGRERVILTLGTPTGGDLGASIVHQLIIADDEPAANLAFSAATSTAAEGAGSVTLGLTLSSPRTEAAQVTFSQGGTAIAGGVDLSTAPASPLVIPAGATGASLTVSLVQDTLDEVNETFVATLVAPQNCSLGGVSQHTLTITDDDAAPTVGFLAGSSSVGEGVGGSSIGVQLSAASSKTITVPVQTSGTATVGSDYVYGPTTLTISPGATGATISFGVVDDSAVEGTETAIFSLGTPNNAAMGSPGSHTVSFLDNDGSSPSVSFNSAGSNYDEASGTVMIPVNLSSAATQTVTVPVSIAGGSTAAPGADFNLVTPQVTFPAGATSRNVQVQILDDTAQESAETIQIALGTSGGAIVGSPSMHTINLADNDGGTTVTFSLPVSTSGESSTFRLVNIAVSQPAPSQITIPLTVSGTASGADFSLQNNPVIIPVGATARQVRVDIVPDSLDEDDETIVLTMGAVTGAGIGGIGAHTLTLVDDDAMPTVAFTSFRNVVDEVSGGFNVRLGLSAASGRSVSVPFTVAGDGAGPGDATLPPSPAVIPPGQTFVDLPVTLVVDRVPELGERILFELAGAPTGAQLGSVTSHLVLINDGADGPVLTGGRQVLTPSAGSLSFAARRVGSASQTQSVFFTNMNSSPVTFTGLRKTGFTKGDYTISYPVPPPIVVQPGAGAEVRVAFAPQTAGQRILDIAAETQGSSAPGPGVELDGTAYGPTGSEVRMTASEVMYVGPGRNAWSADYGGSGGGLASNPTPVAGTDLDELYQTFRLGAQLSYDFTLPNGAYDVRVHSWEPIVSAAGARVFNVRAEGNTVLAGLDVFSEVGGNAAFVTAPLRVTVTDGVLDLDFQSVVGPALVSAIEIDSVPLLSTPTTTLSFGNVDQGAVGTRDVQFVNTGLHTGVIDRLTFRVSPIGDARDFSVTFDGETYAGSMTTVVRATSILLPPGTTNVPVSFAPTFHEDHLVTLEFESTSTGELFSVDAMATGGAEAGWGFLHPVPDQDPVFVVDYDGNGTEPVTLLGAESHTHEPGKALASFEWTVNGTVTSTTIDTPVVLPVGSTPVSLLIGDTNTPPATASDDRTIVVHPVDDVPGLLALYYDGSTLGETFLLDNVPAGYDFAERLTGASIDGSSGAVGASEFTADVMVRWVANFQLGSSRTLDFVATGGTGRRVLVNDVLQTGPVALGAGTHSVEVRFAVSTLANLPIALDIREGSSTAGDVMGSLGHDESGLPPVIHAMPSVGTDLGGNRITIDGFGFFPEAQTVVHWGATDIPSSQFDDWGGESITLTTPPGSGTIQVTVETPGGVSDSFPFTYSPTGPIPVRFTLLDNIAVSISDVTAAKWGPDGNLYVTVLDGSIRILTYNDDWTIQTIDYKVGVSGLVNRDTLGLAFNPFDVYDPQDPTSIKLYLTHGQQYQNGGQGFTGPSYFTGQVSVLTGPNFDNPQPLITQLPVSNHDHSVNGPYFDDNGDLLICVGGNTNGGVAADALGAVPESPLSAAIIRARTSDPNFNGMVLYEDSATGVLVDDQVFGETVDVVAGVDVEVYASGFRNSLDMVQHTNGYLYATDNGSNAGFGPASLSMTLDGGPGSADSVDELNLIEPGIYYGSASRSRGRYNPAEAIFYDASAASIAGQYRSLLTPLDSSTNGIDEYRATAFNSAMRGDLIAAKWNFGLYRIQLSADGRKLGTKTLYDQASNTAFPPNKGLDVLGGPGGALIAIDYSGNKIRVQIPDDVSAVGPTAFDIFPWRVPAGGGQAFVIGGLNFGTNLANVSVTIGGVSATLTSVSDTRIRGVFPASASGAATELLDVNVTVGSVVKSIPRAIRYLPATPGLAKGTWRDAVVLPLPLGELATAVVGQDLYLFGQGDARTFRYDMFQGNWSLSLAQRPFPGNHHGCEVIGDKIYLIGGLDGGSAGKVQIYDTAANVWTTGAAMPWNGGSCATALIGGKIYVGGGNLQGAGTAGNFAVYDPALDTWTGLGMMPTPVNHAASGTDGEKLYVFGGRQGPNMPQTGFDDVQIYDPVTNTWETSDAGQAAPMPLPRGGTGRAVYFGGEFYVMGGEDATNAFDDVQAYDPVTDTWRAEAPMPTARHGIYPTLFESRIFVMGGGLNAGFGFSAVSEAFSPR